LFSGVVHIVNKKFIVALTIIAQRAIMGELLDCCRRIAR